MLGALRKHGTTIVVAMITAMVTAGGPATAAIINATKLNGYKANQLIRVTDDKVVNSSVGAPTDWAPVVTATIQAPKDGYLVMVGSVDVRSDSGTGTVDGFCRLWLDWGLASDATIQESQRLATVDPYGGTPCATNAGLAIAKGNRTVSLAVNTLASLVDWRYATVQVVFVPFGAEGYPPV